MASNGAGKGGSELSIRGTIIKPAKKKKKVNKRQRAMAEARQADPEIASAVKRLRNKRLGL